MAGWRRFAGMVVLLLALAAPAWAESPFDGTWMVNARFVVVSVDSHTAQASADSNSEVSTC